jgi:cell division protein FtsQ
MTELENDVNRKGSKTELSRARQRKLKVERKSGVSLQAGAGSKQQSSTRPRSSRWSGPSVRERFAATQLKIPTSTFKSLQGKLSSKLGHVTRPSTIDQTTKKVFLPGVTLASRHSRRKSETQRNENHYEATASAETQRKTNTDNPFVGRKNRRIYDAHSATVPPVMVRGGMGGMAFGRTSSSRLHKQKAPKRRFDVPLKVQGAEVRLPSFPLIHIGWRVVSLLMVLMMTASLVLIWKSPVFQVKAVEAKGLKRLTMSDLNTVMGTLGASVFTINPQVLEENLQLAFPELEKISVRVNLPANVKVAAIERVPVIAWNQSGSEVWVDAQGVTFPPRGNPEKALVRVEGHGTPPGVTSTSSTNDFQNLPTGLPSATTTTIPKISLSPSLVSAILALGAKMPADTLLVYDSEHGLGWNDPNGWEVFFGAEDQDMEMKLSVYQAMVERLQSEGIQPALISVEYVHAPYYRMER